MRTIKQSKSQIKPYLMAASQRKSKATGNEEDSSSSTVGFNGRLHPICCITATYCTKFPTLYPLVQSSFFLKAY